MIGRYLPPVGTPLAGREIFGALRGFRTPSSEREALEAELSGTLAHQPVRVAPSGGAGSRSSTVPAASPTARHGPTNS